MRADSDELYAWVRPPNPATSNPQLPTLTFYTTGAATTPQLPFWAGALNNMDFFLSRHMPPERRRKAATYWL